jgi:hypothetical protein
MQRNPCTEGQFRTLREKNGHGDYWESFWGILMKSHQQSNFEGRTNGAGFHARWITKILKEHWKVWVFAGELECRVFGSVGIVCAVEISDGN